ncbi:MAG: hypothetical protein Ta2D_05430 [Rickettsiales bacterium]|nr:MAG: hypothetical protein Ta2D_05430 [Rickettsiales bacterium]
MTNKNKDNELNADNKGGEDKTPNPPADNKGGEDKTPKKC